MSHCHRLQSAAEKQQKRSTGTTKLRAGPSIVPSPTVPVVPPGRPVNSQATCTFCGVTGHSRFSQGCQRFADLHATRAKSDTVEYLLGYTSVSACIACIFMPVLSGCSGLHLLPPPYQRASSSRSLLHIVLWSRQNRRFRHFIAQPAMLSRSCTQSDESKPTHPMQRLQPHWPRGCSGVMAVRVSRSFFWFAAFKCSIRLPQEWKNKSKPNKFGQNGGS